MTSTGRSPSWIACTATPTRSERTASWARGTSRNTAVGRDYCCPRSSPVEGRDFDRLGYALQRTGRPLAGDNTRSHLVDHRTAHENLFGAGERSDACSDDNVATCEVCVDRDRGSDVETDPNGGSKTGGASVIVECS